MIKYFEIVPYSLLAGWLIFSIYYLRRAARRPNDYNPYIFESIPQVFPTIGILGTFLGIAIGLWQFDVKEIEQSIPLLLQGLKTAFIASIFGITLSIIFSKLTALRIRKNERGSLDEKTALNKLLETLNEMTTSFHENFIYVDESNNKVKPANYFRDLYEESKKQSQALQSFSTDLSIKIEAGFEKILNNPDKGVIPELQAVKIEIENLGKKLQDPSTEMTQNIVKELQQSLKSMIEEFKTSVSGSTKSELEELAGILKSAGGSLTDFPAKLQTMTDNLNANFGNLQEVVNGISLETRSQTSNSIAEMKKQIEAMSNVITNNMGELQTGQQNLISKQGENLQLSENLVRAFNDGVEKMNSSSAKIREIIVEFDEVKNGLKTVSNEFKNASESANVTSTSLKDAQLRFSRHAQTFFENDSAIIKEINASLIKAKDVSSDYSDKFSIVEKGLQGIFSQIETGLEDYKKAIAASMKEYLEKYTEALTTAADSLAGASAEQKEILDEFTEQLTRLNSTRR